MQERADAIGAELKINSLSGEGTQVSVRWQA
jgi:signal transduction histidine kinase